MGKLEKIKFLNQRQLVWDMSMRCQSCWGYFSGKFMSIEEHLQPSKEGLQITSTKGGEFTHGGWFCHLDEVVRGGKGFPKQVGYLNIGGIILSHKFKPTPAIISTPKTTSHSANSPPWGLRFFFAIKPGFCSSIRRMHRNYTIYTYFIDIFVSKYWIILRLFYYFIVSLWLGQNMRWNLWNFMLYLFWMMCLDPIKFQ